MGGYLVMIIYAGESPRQFNSILFSPYNTLTNIYMREWSEENNPNNKLNLAFSRSLPPNTYKYYYYIVLEDVQIRNSFLSDDFLKYSTAYLDGQHSTVNLSHQLYTDIINGNAVILIDITNVSDEYMPLVFKNASRILVGSNVDGAEHLPIGHECCLFILTDKQHSKQPSHFNKFPQYVGGITDLINEPDFVKSDYNPLMHTETEVVDTYPSIDYPPPIDTLFHLEVDINDMFSLRVYMWCLENIHDDKITYTICNDPNDTLSESGIEEILTTIMKTYPDSVLTNRTDLRLSTSRNTSAFTIYTGNHVINNSVVIESMTFPIFFRWSLQQQLRDAGYILFDDVVDHCHEYNDDNDQRFEQVCNVVIDIANRYNNATAMEEIYAHGGQFDSNCHHII